MLIVSLLVALPLTLFVCGSGCRKGESTVSVDPSEEEYSLVSDS